MLKPINFRKSKATAVILIIKNGSSITAKNENPQIQCSTMPGSDCTSPQQELIPTQFRLCVLTEKVSEEGLYFLIWKEMNKGTENLPVLYQNT